MARHAQVLGQAGQDLLETHCGGGRLREDHEMLVLEVAHPVLRDGLRRQGGGERGLQRGLQAAQPAGVVLQPGEGFAAAKKAS